MPLPRLRGLLFLMALTPVAVPLWGQEGLGAAVDSSGEAAADVGDEDEGDSTGQSIAATVSVEDVVDDEAIEQRLRKILRARQRYGDVQVAADNGVVTFRGQVQSDEDKAWITKLAERTEGVVVVDNQADVNTAIDWRHNLSVIYGSLSTLWKDFLKRLPLIIVALLVLVITAMIARLTGRIVSRLLAKRQRISISLKDLIEQLITIGVWITGIVIAAVVVFPGMTPAKALTVLGLGSVAIGFAFKDIFENFFAGILILWRYPFDPGDFITCGDVTGKVHRITIRNTLIRRLDGELAVIPNATVFKTTVDVLTDQPVRRVRIVCGVAYGEDVGESRAVIERAVRSCSSVHTDRPVEIFAQEFADSSVNFEVAWWTAPKPVDVRASRDEVIEAIKSALDSNGIEIPFPYRTLTFKEPLALSGRPDDPGDGLGAGDASPVHNQDGAMDSERGPSASRTAVSGSDVPNGVAAGD